MASVSMLTVWVETMKKNKSRESKNLKEKSKHFLNDRGDHVHFLALATFPEWDGEEQSSQIQVSCGYFSWD